MVISIDNVYIQTFERNVRHLAQQSPSRLRTCVTERMTNGENHNWERIGPVDATQKASARTATPTVDSPWSRRVSPTNTYHIGDTVEPEDLVQMLVEPKSNIAMAQAMAMRRQVDDIIIAAATGNALDGDGVNNAFPAAQRIDLTGNVGAAREVSIDAILQVQEKFYENDIQVEDMQRPCAVIGPAQMRKLMNLTEVTSGDFQNAKALANGYMPNWLGFDWIVSTRLLAPAAGQSDCLFFTPRAIGLQVNRDITAKVAEDPTLSFAWRIYCMLTMGAVRVEDEHIVNLRVADTVNGA